MRKWRKIRKQEAVILREVILFLLVHLMLFFSVLKATGWWHSPQSFAAADAGERLLKLLSHLDLVLVQVAKSAEKNSVAKM